MAALGFPSCLFYLSDAFLFQRVKNLDFLTKIERTLLQIQFLTLMVEYQHPIANLKKYLNLGVHPLFSLFLMILYSMRKYSFGNLEKNMNSFST